MGEEEPRAGLINVCGAECVRFAKQHGLGLGSLYPDDDGWETTAPGGSVAGDRSAFGVMDMGGNVAEWVADVHRADYTRAPSDPAVHVTRGGTWGDAQAELVRTTNREGAPATDRLNVTGFRCARSAAP